MASAISHVVYADQYLRKNPSIIDHQEFIRGVLFPDIRRVSNITRQQTHNRFEDLDLHFEQLSSFEAGWKFHVWCDMRRNELLLKKRFFEIDQIHDCYYFSYYLLEDRLVWEQYDNWEMVEIYLQNEPPLKLFDLLTAGDWKFWYEKLASFLKQYPTAKEIEKFLKNIPSFSGRTDLILDELSKLEGNKRIVKSLSEIHKELLLDR